MNEIIELIAAANELGAGGKRRDMLQAAIKKLSIEYVDDMFEAGNSPSDSIENLIDTIKKANEKV